MTKSPHAWHKNADEEKRSTWQRLWDAFLVTLGILGGIVSVLTLYPRMTVTIEFNEDDALASAFVLSNDGYLPAYSVSVSCMFGLMDTDPNSDVSGEIDQDFATEIDNTTIPVLTLYPGSKETIPFSSCFHFAPQGQLMAAHIGMLVRYRPMFWFHQRKVSQQLRAIRFGKRLLWHSVPYFGKLPSPATR